MKWVFPVLVLIFVAGVAAWFAYGQPGLNKATQALSPLTGGAAPEATGVITRTQVQFGDGPPVSLCLDPVTNAMTSSACLGVYGTVQP